MLAEFVKSIVDLGRHSISPTFHTHPQLPGLVFVACEGDVEEYKVPPPARAHEVFSVESLAAVLGDKTISPDPQVFVSSTGIFAYLDGQMRRQSVSMVLCRTRQFSALSALTTAKAFQPRDLVKYLRREFPGQSLGGLMQSVSKVDFSRTSSGKTDVAHGRETLGRSVEAVVQKAEDIPESFVVSVPVWTRHGARSYLATVTVRLYVDVLQQALELWVHGDEIDLAESDAAARLVSDLRELLKVPVFLGTAN